MLNTKILNLIYNKNNFIKLIVICILAYIIYLLYHKINNDYEKFVTSMNTFPNSTSSLFTGYGTGQWIVPSNVTEATFTVIGGSGGFSKGPFGKIGGGGAKVTTTISGLKAGDIYYIYVGQNGDSDGTSIGSNSADTNNYFGGGTSFMNTRGGGGAASFISLNNNTTFVDSQNNTTILIVAGGGGGASDTLSGGSASDSNLGILTPDTPHIPKTIMNTSYLGSETRGKSTTINNSSEGGGGGGAYFGQSGLSSSAGVSYTKYPHKSFVTDSSRSPSILIDWTPQITTTQPPPGPYLEGISSTWTVPPGITQATFTVIGGKGGAYASAPPINGGGGAIITTTLTSLKQGDVYYIYVGNNGNDGYGYSNAYSSSGVGGKSSDPNNFFGGGDSNMGGGGSASFVALNNNTFSSTNTFSSNNIIIVAAGGGGGSVYTPGRDASGVNTSDMSLLRGRGDSSLVGSLNRGAGGGGYIGGALSSHTGEGGNGGISYINPNMNTTNNKFASDSNLQGPSILIDLSIPVSTQAATTTTKPSINISPAIYKEGVAESWVVPPGVTEATFTVIGGKGGDSKYISSYTILGGYGGNVTVTLNVNVGEVYNIYVGNNGVSSTSYAIVADRGISADANSSNPFGMFAGGIGTSFTGGGGSASFISFSQASGGQKYPIIIAGGGGGAGRGGNKGVNPNDTGNYTCPGGSGCINKTSNGGNGDCYSTGAYGVSVKSKDGGLGGTGCISFTTSSITKGSNGITRGGGGGGGCNAGTGGIQDGGGGGGGSFVDPLLDSNSISYSTDTTGVPSIIITWSLTKTTQPSTTQPSTTQPSTTQPSTTQPSTTQPTTTQPTTTQPTTTQPTTTQPTTTQSSNTQPSTTQPTTTQPTTTQPTTTQPTTTQPTTTTESNNESNNLYISPINNNDLYLNKTTTEISSKFFPIVKIA